MTLFFRSLFPTLFVLVQDGTMLRIFLSVLLNCDPMRISKKHRLEVSVGKQPFSRNRNAVNMLQDWEKEKKRNDLQNLQSRFTQVCQVLSKRRGKESCAMPSAMPWSNWLTQNEKIVAIKDGNIEVATDTLESSGGLACTKVISPAATLSMSIVKLTIENKESLGISAVKETARPFNRRRSFDEFSAGKVFQGNRQHTNAPASQFKCPFVVHKDSSKRHRADPVDQDPAETDSDRKSQDYEREREKENGAGLQDAFASISSATISSAKMVGLHATPEELAALKDIIGKIKSRNEKYPTIARTS